MAGISDKTLVNGMASCFGAGYVPVFPGTFGSLSGLIVFQILHSYPRWAYILICIVLVLVAIVISDKAEKNAPVKDPKFIVIDEMVGFLCAMIFLPFQLKYVLIAFLLFRIMDIIKPYPADDLQQLKGGYGIVLDDIVAGLYTSACIITYIIIAHILKEYVQ